MTDWPLIIVAIVLLVFLYGIAIDMHRTDKWKARHNKK
jgi:hypothetical protein